MDEVFGNSSTETVVSVQDFNEKHLSSSTDSAEDLDKYHDEPVYNQTNHVSVIKCILTNVPSKLKENEFRIPQVPLNNALRHTQSAAVVPRSPIIAPRVRAHSNATVSSKITPLKHHPYQNIPLNTLKLNSPVYLNVPKIRHVHRTDECSPVITKNIKTIDKSNPTHSYIQLWNGIKNKNVETEDFDKLSATGYVSMSSPYIRSPNSSVLSELAGHLSTYAVKTKTRDIFCPFCPRPFTDQQNLRHHMHAIHRQELQRVANEKENVTVQFCPVCGSRFFNLDLLPNHLLEFHRDSVVDILDGYEAIKLENNQIKCAFCIKQVPNSKIGEEILLYHILQLHSIQFQNVISLLFQPVKLSNSTGSLCKLSTQDLVQMLSFKPGLTSTPGLSLKFGGLSCHMDALEDDWNSQCSSSAHNEDATTNEGIIRNSDLPTQKPHVKRELRFSIPHVTSENVYIPESPEVSPLTEKNKERFNNKENLFLTRHQSGPVRVDSLSSADFIDLCDVEPNKKRRRLGVGLKSKKTFKKKKRESTSNTEGILGSLKNIGCSKSVPQGAPTATRTFRRPKPVVPPTAPIFNQNPNSSDVKLSTAPPPPSQLQMSSTSQIGLPDTKEEPSPFGNLKLYSPLRLFRCNGCNLKFCDNESLWCHVRSSHRGLLTMLRPHYGCGVCTAKFYENKVLVKHCLQHHTSLLEIRSPTQHKITIYRLTRD